MACVILGNILCHKSLKYGTIHLDSYTIIEKLQDFNSKNIRKIQ